VGAGEASSLIQHVVPFAFKLFFPLTVKLRHGIHDLLVPFAPVVIDLFYSGAQSVLGGGNHVHRWYMRNIINEFDLLKQLKQWR
jgi:hypothetical protein